jgi:putative membrane protein
MLPRIIRLAALLAVMVGFGLLGPGSAALANGGHSKGHHGKRHHSKSHSDRNKRSGDRSGNENSGDQGNRCTRGGNDSGNDDNGSDNEGNNNHNSGSCDDGDYSGLDEEWLKMAIQGDLFEIQGGQLALQKSQRTEVRDLATRLIADHTQSLQDATELAQKYGIDVPTEPSPTQQWQLLALQQFSGAQFDQMYSSLEVADHKQDIEEAQDEVEDGCNGEFKREAAKEIPVLQQHLELALRAQQASGGTTATALRKLRSAAKHHKHHHHAHHSRTRH